MGQFGLERLALFLIDPDKDGHLVPPRPRLSSITSRTSSSVDVFRRFGPTAFVTLQELESKQNGAEEMEALRETG